MTRERENTVKKTLIKIHKHNSFYVTLNKIYILGIILNQGILSKFEFIEKGKSFICMLLTYLKV